MDLDIDVQRLKLLKSNHLSQKYALEDAILRDFPQKIADYTHRIEGYKTDVPHLAANTHPNKDGFSPMEIKGTVYTDKKEAGTALLDACKAMTSSDAGPLGQYRGFSMWLSYDSLFREFKVTLKNSLRHTVSLGMDVFGNIQRLDNLLDGMEKQLQACEAQLENTKAQLANAKEDVEKPFPQKEELNTKSARLDELNILLNLDQRENEIVEEEAEEKDPPVLDCPDLER